jgi:hypothetical protein
MLAKPPYRINGESDVRFALRSGWILGFKDVTTIKPIISDDHNKISSALEWYGKESLEIVYTLKTRMR